LLHKLATCQLSFERTLNVSLLFHIGSFRYFLSQKKDGKLEYTIRNKVLFWQYLELQNIDILLSKHLPALINNNNNNTRTMFMVLSSCCSSIARVHPGSRGERSTAPGGR